MEYDTYMYAYTNSQQHGYGWYTMAVPDLLKRKNGIVWIFTYMYVHVHSQLQHFIIVWGVQNMTRYYPELSRFYVQSCDEGIKVLSGLQHL